MNLKQGEVCVGAFFLSCFSSEQTVGDAPSSCLSHKVGQPAWGDKGGSEPNHVSLGGRYCLPVWWGSRSACVCPCSAMGSSALFCPLPPSPPLCFPRHQFPLSKSGFSQPPTALLDLRAVSSSAGVGAQTPKSFGRTPVEHPSLVLDVAGRGPPNVCGGLRAAKHLCHHIPPKGSRSPVLRRTGI